MCNFSQEEARGTGFMHAKGSCTQRVHAFMHAVRMVPSHMYVKVVRVRAAVLPFQSGPTDSGHGTHVVVV